MFPEFSSEYVSTDEVVEIICEGREKEPTQNRNHVGRGSREVFLIGY